ncbi:MAG: sigma-54-dependent Fis family transcriptional regulator [Deltaproteobacteria bacterium]|nr:sigma-54-dependent Fis family transcriptional regulator [Candidatus Zymogenaceae bacterium]
MSENILIVDDDQSVQTLLSRILKRAGYQNIILADSAERALEIMGRHTISMMLLDVRMPGMDGVELLKLIKERDDTIIVIMITAFGSIEQAVNCMRIGAHDFITKPFSSDIVLMSIEKALKNRELVREVEDLRTSLTKEADFVDFIGVSRPMQEVYERIQAVAPTDAPVLITGESGTGKELAAHALHKLSTRANHLLISISCPNIPPQILESELFGHAKGAFTDAHKEKMGLFEKANGGTIFLDEIGDIPSDVQVKLLRVLQEGEILPLGSEKVKKLDVRIITSTNRDLLKKVEENSFREDLYYRINVINIHLPPLRKRVEDIRRLATFFLNEFSAKLSKSMQSITQEAMELLEENPWPGNVRELKNVIHQGVVFSTDGNLTCDALELSTPGPESPGDEGVGESFFDEGSFRESRDALLTRFEVDFVREALKKSGGNISQAARDSNLSRQSFQHLMKKHGISGQDDE